MFWNRFELLCEENNTTPTETVKALNIATGSITYWKNGSIPNGKALIAIADKFNCSVDYLLGRTVVRELITQPTSQDDTKKAMFSFKDNGETITIPYDEIIYFEIINRKTVFKTKNSEFYIYQPIKNIIESAPDYFVQPHKSFLINLNYITKYNRNRNIVLCDNTLIPISRSNNSDFHKRYLKYLVETIA